MKAYAKTIKYGDRLLSQVKMVSSVGIKLISLCGYLAILVSHVYWKTRLLYMLHMDFMTLVISKDENLPVYIAWATILEFKCLDWKALLCYFNHIYKVPIVSPLCNCITLFGCDSIHYSFPLRTRVLVFKIIEGVL